MAREQLFNPLAMPAPELASSTWRAAHGSFHDAKPIPILVAAPRWLLLATLVLAPWTYGSTRPWAIQLLSALLGLICLLWFLECVLRRRHPRLPPVAVAAGAGLVLQGWWMALNARCTFDASAEMLLPRAPLVSIAPGSADAAVSGPAMLLYTGLLGVLLFACDLSQRPAWRKRIWVTLALASVSLALFGVVQKIGGETVIAWIWEEGKREPTNTFATFRYRGNAGAFLNLALPLVAGLAFLNFRKSGRPWRKSFWVASLFILAAGIQLNPSRAGWCIALGIVLVLSAAILWHSLRNRGDAFQPRRLLLPAILVTLALASLGVISEFGGWETSWRRVHSLGLSTAGRRPTEIYLEMVPAAGLMGFGPGTFAVVFPTYQRTHDFGGREFPSFWVTGFWKHAHQDYLQTLIEWGYLGTSLWALIIGGGIFCGVSAWLKWRYDFSGRWFLLCAIVGIIATLVHSFVDFPLQVASIQFYVCVLLGICWGASRCEAVTHSALVKKDAGKRNAAECLLP